MELCNPSGYFMKNPRGLVSACVGAALLAACSSSGPAPMPAASALVQQSAPPAGLRKVPGGSIANARDASKNKTRQLSPQTGRCPNRFVISPGSAAFEIGQHVTLRSEYLVYRFRWPNCNLVRTKPLSAHWTSSGGILKVKEGGTEADFSARTAGTYSVTATNTQHGSAMASALAQINNERLLYSFRGGSDGKVPESGLIADKKGAFYGTTYFGGNPGGGTVFKLTPDLRKYSESVLYTFQGGSDGYTPAAGVIMDTSGALYGTTQSGGKNYGTVYKLTPSASGYTESVLYAFGGGTDGDTPDAGLIVDAKGALYGTTDRGGNSAGCASQAGCGTVFRLTPQGSKYSESVIYSFQGGTDGGNPRYSGLITDRNGALYGTTLGGGASDGCGTAFKLTPQGTNYRESVLYRFQGGSDGCWPEAGVIMNTNGALYGTTSGGGGGGCNGYGCGTAFKLTPNGKQYRESVLYSFQGGSDGASPLAGLIMGASGALYGTTYHGGFLGVGVVFKLTPSGGSYTESVLHSLDDKPNDGSEPAASLFAGARGELYGTAVLGGAAGAGTVFKLTR